MSYYNPIFSVFPISIFLFSLIQIILYFIDSFGIYSMSRNTGMKNPWLAWIPFAKEYLLGSLADRYNNTCHQKKTFLRFYLSVIRVVEIPLSYFALVYFIFLCLISQISLDLVISLTIILILTVTLGILCKVLYLITFYYVMMDFEPSRSVLYTILAFFNLGWICLFFARNNVPVGVAGRCQPRQPKYDII